MTMRSHTTDNTTQPQEAQAARDTQHTREMHDEFMQSKSEARRPDRAEVRLPIPAGRDDRTAVHELRDLLDLADEPAASDEFRSATVGVARSVVASIHWLASPGAAHPGKSYEVQPQGIPGQAPVTLDGEASYILFNAIFDAIVAWDRDDEVLPNEAAYRRLLDLAEALVIATRAQLTAMGPLVAAHQADDHAAVEWKHDRWFARQSRPGDTTTTIGATPSAEAAHV